MRKIEDKLAHGGNVWAAARSYGLSPGRFLDYSANINPLGPPAASLEALQDSLGLIVHYPEPTGQELKNRLGRYLRVDPDNLVLGNGGSELIYLLGRMFGQKRVIRLAPTFAEYGLGTEEPLISEIPMSAEEDFPLPLPAILALMQRGDLLFVGNPNNPTGNLFPRRDLEKIVRQAAAVGAMVVIDEAFIDFVGDDRYSLRDLAPHLPELVVIGSLTKFFAIPGLRLGYAVAMQAHAQRMEKLLPAWRINTMAQAAAMAAVVDQEYITDTIQLINEEREFLVVGLQRLAGLKVYPSSTNFLLVDGTGAGIEADELQSRLGPQGILIRQCQNFNNLSPFHFRLAVRRRADNEILLNTLGKVLEKR